MQIVIIYAFTFGFVVLVTKSFICYVKASAVCLLLSYYILVCVYVCVCVPTHACTLIQVGSLLPTWGSNSGHQT